MNDRYMFYFWKSVIWCVLNSFLVFVKKKMYLFLVYFVDVSCILYLFDYLYCLKISKKNNNLFASALFGFTWAPIIDIVQKWWDKSIFLKFICHESFCNFSLTVHAWWKKHAVVSRAPKNMTTCWAVQLAGYPGGHPIWRPPRTCRWMW